MSLEAKERGPEVSYQLALLITGVALAYWIDLGFVQGLDRHPWLWRIPLAMQACFAIFSAVLLFMLPDTPRWYYARGKEAQGDRVLARLHALPVEHESVQTVKAEILASMEEENDTGKISIVTLFWDNTELQFGRRLRTSFLINWVRTLSLDLLSGTNTLSGTTIPWYQHAGIFLDPDLHQSPLLSTSFWYPRWCPQHRFRPRILPSNLVH
jgi:MFS family permease